jgi:hypothetical protein
VGYNYKQRFSKAGKGLYHSNINSNSKFDCSIVTLSGFSVGMSCLDSLLLKLKQTLNKRNFDLLLQLNIVNVVKGQLRMGKGKGKKSISLSRSYPGSSVLYINSSHSFSNKVPKLVSNRLGSVNLKLKINNLKFLSSSLREL